MNPPSTRSTFSRRQAMVPKPGALALLPALALAFPAVPSAHSATCTSAGPGQGLGTVELTALKEASGLAVSRRNPGVVWSHNDGSGKKVFAFDLEARLLARYDTGVTVDDVEDIAAGPGPIAGTGYLYLADTGGAAEATEVRSTIRIVRVPEPAVNPAASASPPSADFTGVESFSLTYPDGAHDAETLLVDPLTSDVWVVTKQKPSCRLYRANLNSAANGAAVPLTFVRTVAFSEPSGGDISPDGSQIILRNEDAAMIWNRSGAESIDTALGRAGNAVPVIGTPTEPNGEAVALLPGGAGYLTISEEVNPVLYLFEFQCPRAPAVLTPPVSASAVEGSSLTFTARVSGVPAPTYSWKFNGVPLAGQTGATLALSGIGADDAGTYELTATNSGGSAVASAVLTLRGDADVRVTEIFAQPASGNGVTADWWELSNFETEPVSLAGWRFNDNGGGLGSSFTLPAGLVIAPGESVVFVESLSPAQFRAWWGAPNVPDNVQIVTYSGNGLAFSADGDGLRLWNAGATADADTVVSLDFGAATPGVSFGYNPVTAQFGPLSQAGVNGAFRAPSSNDVGSPGLYKSPPVIPDLTVSKSSAGIRIAFSTVAGQSYQLETSEDMSAQDWSPSGDVFVASNSDGGFFDQPISVTRRFFRVRVL